MQEWVLIIAMFSPGGDFMDKLPIRISALGDAIAGASSPFPLAGEVARSAGGG